MRGKKKNHSQSSTEYSVNVRNNKVEVKLTVLASTPTLRTVSSRLLWTMYWDYVLKTTTKIRNTIENSTENPCDCRLGGSGWYVMGNKWADNPRHTATWPWLRTKPCSFPLLHGTSACHLNELETGMAPLPHQPSLSKSSQVLSTTQNTNGHASLFLLPLCHSAHRDSLLNWLLLRFPTLLRTLLLHHTTPSEKLRMASSVLR